MAKANTLEGVADGTVMTTANTAGSGSAASLIVSNGAGASGALTYEADAACYGSMGGRITPAAATSYWRWDETAGGATDRWVVHRTFIHKGTPSSGVTLCSLYATNSLLGNVTAWTTGALRAGSVAGLILASESPALTVGVRYYVCLAITPGTTTANGRVEFRVWTVSTGVQFHTYDSGATQNTGILAIDRCRIGGLLNTQGWAEDDFDQLGMLPVVGAGNFVNPPAAGTNYTRTPADVASVIDTGSPQQIDFEWAQADAAAGVDAHTKVQGLQYPLADTAGAADTLLGLVRASAVADQAAAAEAVQADLQLPGGFSWPRDITVKVGQLV